MTENGTFASMLANRLGRALAIGLAVTAGFYALSSFSMPEIDRRPDPLIAAIVTALMASQAAFYWQGEAVRARLGLAGYLSVQGVIVFIVGMNGALVPVGLGLYMALTAEAVVLAGPRWGAVPVTAGAIVVFGANAIASSNLYFGATAGLMLAVTAMIAQSIAALIQRRSPQLAMSGIPSAEAEPASNGHGRPTNGHSAVANASWNLTPREEEVLRALASGSRSSEIAAQLGITERTVKAHLQTVYLKLGVDSRTAAVAALLTHDTRR